MKIKAHFIATSLILLSLVTVNMTVIAKESSGILAPYETKQVAPHTYVIHGPSQLPNKQNSGFMNNPGFTVTDKSVIVFDPGSSVQIGRELVLRIKKITNNPITHVFISHVHGDHWLANHGINEAFPAAKFYGHPLMIEKANAGSADQWVKLMKDLTEGATEGTKAVIPKNALENGQIIKIDGISIKAHLSKEAHTETDIMYQVVEDKVLFTGDNITYHRIPRLADGSFVGNIAVAELGLELPVDVIVPGHGETGGKEVIKAFHAYLSIVYTTSMELAEEGLDAFEMKPKVREKLVDFKDWSGLEEQLGKHISQAVLEAEEAEF